MQAYREHHFRSRDEEGSPLDEDRRRLILTCCHPALAPGARIPYVVPSEETLPERRDAVMAVLYLIFNEGYAASFGARLVRGLELLERLSGRPDLDRYHERRLAEAE